MNSPASVVDLEKERSEDHASLPWYFTTIISGIPVYRQLCNEVSSISQVARRHRLPGNLSAYFHVHGSAMTIAIVTMPIAASAKKHLSFWYSSSRLL